MAFTQTFSVTTPLSSTAANTLDTILKNDKFAVNERLELEHNALNSTATGATDPTSPAAQGRHMPGKVSAVYIGTTAQIAALTGMTSGALAYDTDKGILEIYNGTNWTTYSVGAFNFGAKTTLTTASFTKSFTLDMTNAIDGDWTTATAEVAIIAGPDYFYIDLGAVYHGKMLMRIGARTASRGTLDVYVQCDYVNLNLFGTALAFSDPIVKLQNSTAESQHTISQDFFGRYVGLKIYAGGDGGYYKFYEIEIHGSLA